MLAVERFGPLPETLRELLLGRYATLSTDTQVLVRLVAAGGPRVQHRLVTRVHNGDTGSLDRAMRQAIAAQVLRADGDAYRFRHALIHEAVHGELLPGEVHRFHARYAEALEADARMDSRHAEIAHHWQLADDDPRTLAALVAASHEARADGAPGAAAELGQQALALWTRVDTPERVAGCSSAQLLLEVGSALDAASDPQALPFLERSVEEVPEPDRRGRALLLHQAMLVRDSEGLAGALDLGRRALELLPDEGDDEARLTRVRVETGVGVVELMNELRTARGRLQVAVAQARELIARADDASIASRASVELARGLSHLGAAQVIDGEVERGFAALAEAGRYSGADVEDAVRRHMLRAWLLYYLGRYRESLAAAHEGGEIATSWGMARGFGAAMAVLDAWSRLALGELDAAAAVARGVREAGPVHTARAYCAEIEAELMLLRDEPQAAATVLSESQGAIDRLRSNSRSNDLRFARLDAEIALAVGNPGAAFAALEPLWNWPDPRPGPSFAALGVGARVVARLRRGPTPLPGISLADAEQRLRRVLDQLSVWDVAEDWRALLEAELSGDDVTAWQTARDAAVRGRVPKRLHVHALERLAAAQVRAGDRDAAATAIDEAAAIADRAGMLEASRAIGALAARARLQTRREHPQDGSALTARERQVLDLIAQGLTNRQIGDRLFISAKTASVHVSAILRKLGAATRAEAAARARDIL